MEHKKLGFGWMRLPVLQDGEIDMEQVKKMADLFLENGFTYDFTGKTVIPFNTHEGSGQAGTQSVITNKLSGATVLRGLAMQGSTSQKLSCDGSNASVKSWLEGLGFFK